MLLVLLRLTEFDLFYFNFFLACI